MENILLVGESTLLLVGKIGLILFLVIYVIFAAVIIKQVRMMTDTLDLGFENPIKLAVFLHFLFSLITLLLAIVIL